MESLVKESEELNLEEPSLETTSFPTSPSTEVVPDDLEERSATCSQEPDPGFLDEIWKNFVEFMKLRATVRPYPKFLYRAHVHGHPFPRFIDANTYKYADAFSSEFHAFTEEDCQCEIDTFISPFDSILDLFKELRCHLQKTQLRLNGSEYLSRMVSLSGDFYWTTHRLCEVDRKANEDQIPGLAIFDVERIQEIGQIWRVSDMLEFFDMLKKLKVAMGQNPIEVPKLVRPWSQNADEYVCWEYIPQEALISFIKLSDLTSSGLLNSNFTNSINIGDLKRRAPEPISLNEYKARVSAFLRAAMAIPLCLEQVDAESIANQLTPYFLNPCIWSYEVPGFAEDMEDLVAGLRDDLIRQIQQKSTTEKSPAPVASRASTPGL
ncbi:hypothetical protein MY3296_007065 [Beauveria thailandica]